MDGNLNFNLPEEEVDNRPQIVSREQQRAMYYAQQYTAKDAVDEKPVWKTIRALSKTISERAMAMGVPGDVSIKAMESADAFDKFEQAAKTLKEKMDSGIQLSMLDINPVIALADEVSQKYETYYNADINEAGKQENKQLYNQFDQQWETGDYALDWNQLTALGVKKPDVVFQNDNIQNQNGDIQNQNDNLQNQNDNNPNGDIIPPNEENIELNNAQNNIQNQNNENNIQNQNIQNNAPAVRPYPDRDFEAEFTELLEQKKAALIQAQKNTRGMAFYRLNAEYIFLKDHFNRHREEYRNQSNLTNLFDTRIKTGNYNQETKNKLEQYALRAWELRNKIKLPDAMMIPEEVENCVLKQQAYNSFSQQQADQLRTKLYNEGRVDFLVGNPPEEEVENFTEEFKKSVGVVSLKDANPGYYQIYKNYEQLPQQEKERLKGYMTDAGFRSTAGRTSTFAGVFLVYLLGREENAYSLEDAMKIVPQHTVNGQVVAAHPKFQEEYNNYVQFLKDNFVTENHVIEYGPDVNMTEQQKAEDKAAKLKANTKRWRDLYAKSAKKIGDYKFPDIDYSDQEAVKAHAAEFNILAAIEIEHSQTNSNFLGSANNEYVSDGYPGGLEGYQNDTSTIDLLGQFTKNYGTAYKGTTIYGSMFNDGFHQNVYRCAASGKYVFGLQANGVFRNRTINSLNRLQTPKDLYTNDIGAILSMTLSSDKSIPAEACKDFLSGKDIQTFKNHAERHRETTRKDLIELSNNTTMFSVPGIISKQITNQIWEKENVKNNFVQHLSDTKTAAEIKEFLFSEQGAATKSAIETTYFEAFGKDTSGKFFEVFRNCVHKDVWDLIKINGVPAQELWGQKYDGVAVTEEDKKILYTAELMKEVTFGNSHITMDTYLINHDDEFEESKTIDIVLDTRTLEQTQKFLKAMKPLNENLTDLFNKVQSIKDDEVLPEAKESFATLKATLKGMQPFTLSSAHSYEKLTEDFETVRQSMNNFISEQTDAINAIEQRQIQAAADQNGGIRLQGANAVQDTPARILRDDLLSKKSALEPLITKIEAGFNEVNKYTEGKDFSKTRYLQGQCPEELVTQKNLVENTFRARFNNPRSLDNNLDMEVYDGQYRWLNEFEEFEDPDDYETTRITAEQMKMLERESGIGIRKEVERRFTTNPRRIVEKYGERLVAANYPSTTRLDTMNVTYMFWAMKAKGLTFVQAAHLNDEPISDEIKGWDEEFVKFCEKYPFHAKKVETDEEAVERLKPWLEVWENAQKEIEKYRLPDIDFSNANQVKDYIDELTALRTMGGDGVQEWEELFLKYSVNPASDLKEGVKENLSLSRIGEKIFGKERFWKNRLFFFKLQGFGDCLTNGYAPIDSHTPNLKELMLFATQRFNAQKSFGKYKGQTVAAVMEGEGCKLDYQDEMSSIIIKQRTGEGTYVKKGLTAQRAVAYLLNVNRDVFEAKANQALDEELANINDYYEAKQKEDNSKNFLNGMATNSKNLILDEIADVPDDAQSMVNFLARKTPNGLLYEDLLRAGFDKHVLGGAVRMTMLGSGDKESDIFIIDGKTPREIWGDKYAHIENESLKEHLLLAEVAKATKQFKQISMKIYKFEGKNAVPGKTLVVFKDKPTLEKITEGVGKYIAERNDILSELYVLRDELISTQSNKSANFKDGEEGSAEYKAMTQAMRNAINLLEEEKEGLKEVDPAIIRRSLQTLEETANRYAAAKTKIRSDWMRLSDGRKRIRIARKAGAGFTARFDKIRGYFAENDMVVDGSGKSVGEESINRLAARTNMYRDTGLNAKSRDGIERDYLKSRLREEFGKLRVRVANTSYSGNELLAYNYLMAYFEELTKADVPGTTPVPLDADDIRMMENFDARIKELANNKTFVREMKANPDKVIKDYRRAEIIAKKEKQREFALKYKNTKSSYGTLLNYVADKKNATKEAAENELRQLITAAANENAANENGNPADVDGAEIEDAGMKLDLAYSRLADLVIWQSMADITDVTELAYRIEICMYPEKEDLFKQKCIEYLKREGALTADKIGNLKTKLDEFSFRDGYLKYLEDDRTRTANTEKVQRVESGNVIINALSTIQRSDDPEGDVPEQIKTVLRENTIIGKATRVAGDFTRASLQLFAQDTQYVIHGPEEERQLEENGVLRTVKIPGPPVRTVKITKNLLDNAGMDSMRLPSLNAVFILYCMANGVSLDKAYEMSQLTDKQQKGLQAFDEAQQMRAKFLAFIEDNPTMLSDNNPKEQVEKSFRNWADLYQKGTEAFMKETLPDANYKDLGQLEKNLNKIFIVSKICIDVDQEFDRCFKMSDEYLLGRRIAREHLGRKYTDYKDFYWNLSGKLDPIYAALIGDGTISVNDNRHLHHFLDSRAALMCIGMDQLNKVGGKNLNDIAGMGNAKAFGAKFFSNEVASSFGPDVTREKPVPLKKSVAFIAGENNGYEKEPGFKFAVKYGEDGVAKLFLRDQAQNDASFVGQLNETEPIYARLIAIEEDNAQAMEDFLSNPDFEGSQRTGLDWMTYSLLENGPLSYCRELIANRKGMAFSEFFLVDNKSPEENWGAKYEHVKDPVKKEYLYRLEIIKALAKGEKDVYTRIFAIEGEDLVEKLPQKISPKRERMIALADAANTYRGGVEVFLEQLDGYKNRLAATQADPENNFSLNTEKVEGDSQYKEMTADLRLALYYLKRDLDDDVNPEDIRLALGNLEYSVKQYVKTHKGKHLSEGEQTRLNCATELQKLLPVMKERFEQIRANCEDDLISIRDSGTKNFKNTSFYAIYRTMKKFEENHGLEVHEPIHYRQKFIKDAVLREGLAKLYAEIPTGTAYTEHQYKIARLFVVVKIMDAAEKGIVTSNDLTKIQNCEEQIQELLRDKGFRVAADRYPVFTALNWNVIEDRIVEITDNISSNLEQILTENRGSLTAYVTGVDGPEDITEDAEAEARQRAVDQIKAAADPNKYDYQGISLKGPTAPGEKDMYDRLTEVVSLQMLSNESKQSKEQIQILAMTRGNDQANLIYKTIKAILKDAGKVLEDGNAERTLKRLESGELADEVAEAFPVVYKQFLNNGEPAREHAMDLNPVLEISRNANKEGNQYLDQIRPEDLATSGETIMKTFIKQLQPVQEVPAANVEEVPHNEIEEPVIEAANPEPVNEVNNNINNNNNNIINPEENIIHPQQNEIPIQPGFNGVIPPIAEEDNVSLLGDDDRTNILDEEHNPTNENDEIFTGNNIHQQVKDKYFRDVQERYKPALQQMGKGIKKDHALWSEKVTAFIKVATAHEWKKHNDWKLEEDDSTKKMENKVFKNDPASMKALKEVLERCDGATLIQIVETNSLDSVMNRMKAELANPRQGGMQNGRNIVNHPGQEGLQP